MEETPKLLLVSFYLWWRSYYLIWYAFLTEGNVKKKLQSDGMWSTELFLNTNKNLKVLIDPKRTDDLS